MSNPFINKLTSGSSSNVNVHNISPNYFGKISVPLTSLPDVVIGTENLVDSQVLVYDILSSKWKNHVD